MDPQPPAATGPRTCPASSHYGVTGFLTRSRSEFDGASTLGGNATGAMIFRHCICGKQGGGNHNVIMMFANTSIASKLMLGSSQSPKVSFEHKDSLLQDAMRGLRELGYRARIAGSAASGDVPKDRHTLFVPLAEGASVNLLLETQA